MIACDASVASSQVSPASHGPSGLAAVFPFFGEKLDFLFNVFARNDRGIRFDRM